MSIGPAAPPQPGAPPQMGAPQPGQPPQPGAPQPGQPGMPPEAPRGPTPPDIKVNSGTETMAPRDATMRFVTNTRKRLTEQEWSALSNDLMLTIKTTLSARSALDANLQEFSDAYDMISPQIDDPMVDAPNLRLPYIASQVESMKAYIAGTVIVPRLIIVVGNGQNDDSAVKATSIEKFYNAENVRLRADGESYFAKEIEYLHFSLRDGTGIAEILWAQHRQRMVTSMWVPKVNPDGSFATNEDGTPAFEEVRHTVDVYIKDYAQWTNVPLKEFIMIPHGSKSPEAAAAVGRVEWLYEDELMRRCQQKKDDGYPLFDEDEVLRALDYVPTGMTDLGDDPEGTYDKTASQQIDPGVGQGSLTSKFFKNRGPIKVWRLHSRQFDMNGDGRPEENVFWWHEKSQRMLGYAHFDYAVLRRPFHLFCPFPRPGEAYGYSLIERLAGVGAEIDAQHNERRAAIMLRILPPPLVKAGSILLTKALSWDPTKPWEVEDPTGPNASVAWPQLPDVPLTDFQQEALDKSYGDEYTGLGQPAMGGQSSGKRSATEMRQRNMAQGTRLGLICQQFRVSLTQIFNYIHALNKQYLRTAPDTVIEGQTYMLPLDVLTADVNIGIAGATEPIDSITRRQEYTALAETLLTRFPWIAQSAEHSWYVARMLVESYQRPDVTQLIGSEQEAQQRAQAQQAQTQKQTQLAEQADQAAMARGEVPPSIEPHAAKKAPHPAQH